MNTNAISRRKFEVGRKVRSGTGALRDLIGTQMGNQEDTANITKSIKVAAPGGSGKTAAAADPFGGHVMSVETNDFTDLVPEGRDRVQSMDGFDDCYTDIVDYIIRCTHKIWDERDIGLIYTHYTHNIILYGPMGTIYDREAVVQDTIQRLVSLPERRGLATQVVWNGNDKDGFYTSHLVTGQGRHTQYGHYGPPTGRRFVSRTVADCMILRNKIYREWVVSDQMAVIKQLGLDVEDFATKIAEAKLASGIREIDIGETGLMLGQYPPSEMPLDTSIANNDLERETLEMLHGMWNRKMLGQIRDKFAPTVMYHGPLMKELYGTQSVTHQILGLIGTFPDAVYVPHHICSTPCIEGGTKVAVRWTLDGHHLGHGMLESLGAPTGKYVRVLGMTHYHYKDGKIVDEWTVYDELSLLVQVRMAQLADAKSQAEALDA